MKEQAKPNNLRKFFSNLAFVLFSIIGGIVVGLIVGSIGAFIYMTIIFPIIMGFAGGKVITDNAKFTKTTNASLILVTSLLTAAILFATTFYTRFLGFYVMTAVNELGGLDDQNLKVARAVVDYALEEETGHQGFVGYILFKANQGVAIGRIFRNSSLHLVPIMTWLYWLGELGVIAFITVYIGREFSKKPFCENCNAWYEGKRHIGGARLGRELGIRNLIKLHDYAAIGKMLEENMDVPGLELYLQSCPTCEKSDSFLTVTKTGKEKGRLVFTDLLNTTLTPQENKLLLEGINFAENQGIARETEIA
jgi:hypothetical protein